MSTSKHKILIGSDPEVFLRDKRSIVNAGGRFITRGTKEHPEKTAYGAIQIDGIAVELNTNPTDDPKEFASLIKQGMDDVLIRAGNGILLSERSAVRLSQTFMKTWGGRACMQMGCDPDFNAWKDADQNMKPPASIPVRAAGGHIHIGWLKDSYDGEHMPDAMGVVKQMDYVLGLWSLREDAKGANRRKLYGMPGAFRLKPYGVEYRVLSNFWMFKEELATEVHTRALRGADAYLSGAVRFPDKYGDAACRLIAEGVFNNEAKMLLGEVDEALGLAA